MKIVFGGRKWTVAGRFSRPERGADGDRHRPPMDEPPLHETAGEREEVLDPVQFAERTGHEELHVIEVLAGHAANVTDATLPTREKMASRLTLQPTGLR